jgi:hypothetical protein
MLIVLTQLPSRKHKCLRDQQNSLQYFWVLVVKEVSFTDKLNQFIHEAFKLIRIFLSTMMHNGAKSAQATGDEPRQVSALSIIQVGNHKRQKEIGLHKATE